MESLQILITGANRGLGLELAAEFLRRGHRVCAINRNTSDAWSALEKQYSQKSYQAPGDVADEDSIEKALHCIAVKFGHLDLIINNAGVHWEQTNPLIEDADLSVYAKTYEVNSVGPLRVVKHSLPLLRQGRLKLIANISSESGSIGSSRRRSEYSYCMSKAALNMACKILQNSLKDEGIKVLAVHPGWFRSDMGGPAAPISTAESARAVAELLLKPVDLDGPIYVDLHGDEMEW
ncbi:SDR family NAD(P)-dependent oxidoreductase [Candidatus Sumerlaeota bacterium]|nr:SDR family NAD(P)-dependent oxidoreductase [Candidatus Sumerlaeota bacterium]